MKQIFIFSSRSLFSQGVKSLLDTEPGLDVVGWETDLDKALACIKELQPDVVLLITQYSTTYPSTDGQYFLRGGVTANMVELNLKDNNVYVYRAEHQPINEVGELVRILEQSLTDSSGSFERTPPAKRQEDDGGG